MAERGNALATIARGAGVVLLGILAGSALGYAQKLVVAHHLPPGGFGRVTLGLAVVGIGAALATFGLREGVARYVARHADDERVVLGTLRAAFAIGVTGALVVGLLVHWRSAWIAERVFHDPFMGDILRIMAPLIPLQVAMQLAIATFRGSHVAGYKAIVADVLQPALVVVLLLALLPRGFGAEGGAFAYLVAGAVAAVAAFLLLEFRTRSIVRSIGRPAAAVGRSLVAFSWPLALTGILWLVVAWTDVTMLGALRSSFDVGIYSVALPTSQLLLIPLNAVAFFFMPSLAALAGRGEHAEARRVFEHVTRWLFMASFPVWIFLAAFAEPLVTGLFGVAYAEAAGPLRVLATGFLVATVVGPTGNALVALGKPRLNLAFAGTAAVLNIVLNVLLIPQYGAMGAAVATATSVAAANAVSLLLVRRVLGVQPFTRALAAPAAAAVLAAAPLALAAFNLRSPGAGVLLALLLAYGALYAVALLLLRALRHEDLDVLDELAQAVPALAPPIAAITARLRRVAS